MLKNFFFNLYLIIFNFSFYLVTLLSIICVLLITADLRKKFPLFIITIFLFSIFGFFFDLDGIFLIFLVAEFTIFLLFLMTYTQLLNQYTLISSNTSYYLILILLVTSINITSTTNFYFFVCYYRVLNSITSADFFILYYFLYEKAPLITIIIVFIISFFSLFFIILYFSLKIVKSFSFKDLNQIYFIRKQLLTKQSRFLNKIYTFQN